MASVETTAPGLAGSLSGQEDARAAGLSEDAFTALYRAHRDRLLAHAYGITRDFHGACDVVQETFLRASREVRLGREEFRVRAWLLKVCGHLALNRVRDEARRREREARGAAADFYSKDATTPSTRGRAAAAASPDAAEEALGRQMGRELLTAMQALPPAYRRVLLLRYAEELSCAEISELLGVPAGTVMSWVHRARLVLRRRLSP
ncbi:MAG: RNA polymerase sigma factor [Candidatus Wallbacteria bacterium]|nr:RNA polymerase sigma factor [Candidatus Wallbacteria bacterium]